MKKKFPFYHLTTINIIMLFVLIGIWIIRGFIFNENLSKDNTINNLSLILQIIINAFTLISIFFSIRKSAKDNYYSEKYRLLKYLFLCTNNLLSSMINIKSILLPIYLKLNSNDLDESDLKYVYKHLSNNMNKIMKFESQYKNLIRFVRNSKHSNFYDIFVILRIKEVYNKYCYVYNDIIQIMKNIEINKDDSSKLIDVKAISYICMNDVNTIIYNLDEKLNPEIDQIIDVIQYNHRKNE